MKSFDTDATSRCEFTRFAVAVALGLGLACTNAASAATWTGGNGNWSSDANPGWNGTGVPNAVGAIADFGSATTNGTTTQDIAAGVTVGTISYTANGNQNRTITLTNAITLNQDGAGAGAATISNTNTNTTGGALTFSAGTLTLADNLLITNSGGSPSTNGAIRFQSTIGGAGNITISNTSTSQNDSTGAGAVRFDTGANTFTGSVSITTGLVTFNNASSFGGVAGNMVTIGSSGQNASLLSVATSNVNVANNWQVASGAATAVLGSISTSNVAQIYSGTGTLNSTLSLRSEAITGGRVELSGPISGNSGITKIGAGLVRLTNSSNSYSGGTTVNAGTLATTSNGNLGTGNVTLANTAGVTLTLGNTASIGDSAILSFGQTNSVINMNFTGIETLFGITNGAFTIGEGTWSAAQLNDFFADGAFGGTSGTNFVDAAGNASFQVVPEPNTYAMLLGSVGMLLGFQRTRRATRNA